MIRKARQWCLLRVSVCFHTRKEQEVERWSVMLQFLGIISNMIRQKVKLHRLYIRRERI